MVAALYSAHMTEFESCVVLVALLLLLQRFTVFVMSVFF